MPSGGPFHEARRVRFDWTRTLSLDEVFSLFATFSWAIVMRDEKRRTMEREPRHQRGAPTTAW